MWYDKLLENQLLPDFLIRIKIRALLQQRLQDEHANDAGQILKNKEALIAELKRSPIAIETAAANEQHYEVPTEFYRYCLGSHLKYSSGYWNNNVKSLNEAERAMLELSCDRAELQDGQNVLELGCGWGSLTLFMAAKFPNSKFTAVSNSRTQKIYIDEQAGKRGLRNIQVITADINVFETEQTFDRVVSVEMFEHLRNYELLFKKIGLWLKDDGKMFVHIFTHKNVAYKFEVKDESDWMSKYFFTGGIMPSNDLFSHFSSHLQIKQHWPVNGTHYAKTAEAWLKNMDAHKKEIMPLFANVYGKKEAKKWWMYWRIFYMACAELWNYNNGEEWMVCHYLFQKK